MGLLTSILLAGTFVTAPSPDKHTSHFMTQSVNEYSKAITVGVTQDCNYSLLFFNSDGELVVDMPNSNCTIARFIRGRQSLHEKIEQELGPTNENLRMYWSAKNYPLEEAVFWRGIADNYRIEE